MVKNPHNIEGRVAEVVRTAVSRERGIPVSETESEADLMDDSQIGPDGFYRIIVDVEQALGVGVSEGNWELDDCTLRCGGDHDRQQQRRLAKCGRTHRPTGVSGSLFEAPFWPVWGRNEIP
jgi:hypothetical protein